MYFKIEKSGCNVRKGLVEIRYDLYLDEKDYNFEAHYVDVPNTSLFTGEMYTQDGERTKEYTKWLETAPKIKQHNPFCCHFCQFNPDVTDEEILYVGELALDMAYKNWCKDNLRLNKNLPVKFDATKTTESAARLADVLPTAFTKIQVKSKVPYSVK